MMDVEKLKELAQTAENIGQIAMAKRQHELSVMSAVLVELILELIQYQKGQTSD